MRLSISKSSNATSLYIIKSTYTDGKHSSKIVEKLGTLNELSRKLPGQDPIEWAKRYVEDLNRKEKEKNRTVTIRFNTSELIKKGERRSYNCGYLFLQKIYHELRLDKICNEIAQKHKFTFDLDEILSRLVYGRIIYPGSKLSTYKLSHRFLEQPCFELQHVYRALDAIAEEMDFIQAETYKNSTLLMKRRTGVLYYDCTNFFFEIEQEDGLKQYGYSKEHRPSPIVQMGLFMDADGIPLSLCINAGNTNEQITMTPLEKKVISDYGLSKFIVCTDAGLASAANRKFNDIGSRAYITTQSIKKLKKHLRDWTLAKDGWKLPGSEAEYSIAQTGSPDSKEEDTDKVYFKERWIKEDGLEQRLIVSYSKKYRDYQQKIRIAQVLRARKLIASGPAKINKKGQNDYRRFIKRYSAAKNGEAAQTDVYAIDENLIAQEGIFDGYYAVCTNLQDKTDDIVDINHKRWEIEECFRIMKTDFKSRPVYLSRDERIKAHFMTCFLALLLYRLLEKKLEHRFSGCQIIETLKGMNLVYAKDDGYIPVYDRNDLTDALHGAFGFRTDNELVLAKDIKKILRNTRML